MPFFRNIYISRFFRKSNERLELDILVILGDIAAKRPELGKGDCSAVLQQLHLLIGPFDGVLVVGVEKLEESESFDVRQQPKDSQLEAAASDEINMHSDCFPALSGYPPPDSGPVVLLLIPHGCASE
ncbi:uncharacterized protein LOC110021494 [Phalaenopsis equestris]|uniref:uncharacterized protein LOC110021494 n=1 Tax=Phalaenopsis equestris TaxID=78828 RepID=UPI0009E4DF83|nr:uncharacterized protein LOC110021494 [Phalaenopsis equestris]XP_020575665.1 uncharacterized protein LOC110021494 [Phalaenopsis equestris]XP_020575666.1 uncharacterized protein LOC110021494 [Phalaenopsis equestris]